MVLPLLKSVACDVLPFASMTKRSPQRGQQARCSRPSCETTTNVWLRCKGRWQTKQTGLPVAIQPLWTRKNNDPATPRIARAIITDTFLFALRCWISPLITAPSPRASARKSGSSLRRATSKGSRYLDRPAAPEQMKWPVLQPWERRHASSCQIRFRWTT